MKNLISIGEIERMRQRLQAAAEECGLDGTCVAIDVDVGVVRAVMFYQPASEISLGSLEKLSAALGSRDIELSCQPRDVLVVVRSPSMDKLRGSTAVDRLLDVGRLVTCARERLSDEVGENGIIVGAFVRTLDGFLIRTSVNGEAVAGAEVGPKDLVAGVLRAVEEFSAQLPNLAPVTQVTSSGRGMPS